VVPNYREEIGGAIKKADKVIVLWSEHSVRSDFVTDEAARAKAATNARSRRFYSRTYSKFYPFCTKWSRQNRDTEGH
jgi:hypothetical protein